MSPLSRLSRLSLGSLVLLGACADANPVGPTPTPSLGRAKTTAAGDVPVVLTGLNAPKQLAFGPEGALYVVGGEVVAGPHDIAFQGRGNMYVTIGLGADPALRSALPEGANLGTLIVVKPNGKWSVVADIAGFEAANNPDDGVPDSNPFGVLAEGARQYVTDAVMPAAQTATISRNA